MIFKMGYDGQCERCGRAVMSDEIDDAGDCEKCREEWEKKQIAYWKPLWEGERRAGLHDGLTDYEMRKLKGMIK